LQSSCSYCFTEALGYLNPLQTDPADRLQQQGQKQLLRRDRGAPTLGIKPAEGGIEAIQGLIRQQPHLSRGWALGMRSSVET
jgi:hypothetical protein